MSKVIYAYRLTVDSGLAPCVDDGLFTLACCKGGTKTKKYAGMRHAIGKYKESNKDDNVYLLGIYKDTLLFFAEITEVVTMEKYYSGRSKGRTDDIYKLSEGGLVRNSRHTSIHIHTDKDEIIRDIYGKYVLISDHFSYFGCKSELIAPEVLDVLPHGRKSRGHRCYLEGSEEFKRIMNYLEDKLYKGESPDPHKPLTKGGCGK